MLISIFIKYLYSVICENLYHRRWDWNNLFDSIGDFILRTDRNGKKITRDQRTKKRGSESKRPPQQNIGKNPRRKYLFIYLLRNNNCFLTEFIFF
jgi:hypothetical protein